MSDFPTLSFLSQKALKDTTRKGNRVKSYSVRRESYRSVGSAYVPSAITVSNKVFDRIVAQHESGEAKPSQALLELMASDD